MISHFFIDRPIFASVLSIVFILAGGVAVFTLPVAQYPDVTPPTVIVTALYPGANAQTVRDTVAAPIEAQVSGVEGMMYMSSQSTNDGAYNLIVTFKLGMDSDMAQVLVQNRVSLALPVIPALVQNEGINVKKMSPSTMMIVNLTSPDNRYDSIFLSNYATIYIRDELGRLPGVAGITYLGQRDYSLRVWLDPDKLAALNMSAIDVIAAISSQNVQVAAGQIGQQPVPKGQQFQLTINTLGRLTDPEQFADIIIKVGTVGTQTTQTSDSSGQGGTATQPAQSGQAGMSSPTPQATSVVRLRDVARVELGAQQYDQSATLDGQPTVALSIYQLPGTNALQTAQGVYKKMKELKARFPDGLDYQIVYDTTPFIRESVNEVFKTLRDAVILVALVVLVFLQNWRAAIIPLIAVPVAIVGTFAVMAALQFSLNNLTLFGLVLAIGIVVDDAIVVVENVERHLEQGEPPREAARKAMDEVTGPVIAIALVLCAVFVPCAFLGGISGQFFRQFAVTIAISMVISAFNSLTLSPALAAILLRPRGVHRDPLTWVLDMVLGWFFKLFNVTFSASTNLYTRLVGNLLRISLITLLIYGGLLALTYWQFSRAPTGFIPQQDKGYVLLNVQLPDSASVERTQKVMAHIEKLAHEIPGVAHTVGISGQSLILSANAPNLGSMYVMLKDFHDRRGSKETADAVAAALTDRCKQEVSEAVVSTFGAPPVDGLGTTGGFKFIVEDRGNLGLETLQQVSDRIVATGNKTPGLQGLFNSSRANTPWLYLEIDRTKCMALGVLVNDVFNTLQVYLGSFYVNNFNEFGRTWQVNIQADQRFRDRVRDIRQLQVRNNQGQMIRLGTLMDVRDTSGPVMVMRYNMYFATAITGNTAPGISSGEGIDLMQEIAGKELLRSMAYDWTELTYLQLQAGNVAIYVFALAVVFVFLVLAAQYESWSLPLAVILVVPMCLLCSITGVELGRLEVNIFTQIGFVVLVGLASKNAILVVEFAKQQHAQGKSRREATLIASRLRLRPILMTSFAFIFGVIPLVIAQGAGAEMRRALGLAVFSGMLGVTLFGIFLTPVFFYVIQWFGDRKNGNAKPSAEPEKIEN
ncbi:MAG: efflux RND transporter permease subunit [Thermoguttaceae bacterium]|jgi:hydrophobe/amphiphile efflux-1 (HAE1) family protein